MIYSREEHRVKLVRKTLLGNWSHSPTSPKTLMKNSIHQMESDVYGGEKVVSRSNGNIKFDDRSSTQGQIEQMVRKAQNSCTAARQRRRKAQEEEYRREQARCEAELRAEAAMLARSREEYKREQEQRRAAADDLTRKLRAQDRLSRQIEGASFWRLSQVQLYHQRTIEEEAEVHRGRLREYCDIEKRFEQHLQRLSFERRLQLLS